MEREIEESLKEFNKYREPEIEGRLIALDRASFTIEFEGSFCRTCGFYDYFEDYQIVLEEMLNMKTRIIQIDETGVGAVVVFEILV